jgi:hypothetical protein
MADTALTSLYFAGNILEDFTSPYAPLRKVLNLCQRRNIAAHA